jgi:hypothetical protein
MVNETADKSAILFGRLRLPACLLRLTSCSRQSSQDQRGQSPCAEPMNTVRGPHPPRGQANLTPGKNAVAASGSQRQRPELAKEQLRWRPAVGQTAATIHVACSGYSLTNVCCLSFVRLFRAPSSGNSKPRGFPANYPSFRFFLDETAGSYGFAATRALVDNPPTAKMPARPSLAPRGRDAGLASIAAGLPIPFGVSR